jgi:transcriptional regulator with GAF, ATPase, and Fis domain
LTHRPADPTLRSSEGRATPGSEVASEWALTLVHCPVPALVGRRFVIGKQLRIGRVAAADADVAIDDPKISRLHATLTRSGLVVEIHDEGSSNGTRVNGERVNLRALVPGDIVRIGNSLFEIDDAPPREPSEDPTLVGKAPAFLAAVELADRVAPSDLPVLLLGETGTGKDVLARHIHAKSGLGGSFVAVNCAALPGELVESALFGHRKGAFTGAVGDSPGFFLEAQGGTLFLDEVGELAVTHQAKLLRALDSREIVPVGGTRRVQTDARVIAATNVELLTETADGRFRADLYARLAGAVIRMPPLRARRGDILALAGRFLAERAPAVERRISVQAAERLLVHPWPRNVRELLSTTRRLSLHLGDRAEVTLADIEAVLEPPVAAQSGLPQRRAGGARAGMPPRDELVNQLTSLRGNVSRLAEHYGKDAKQIYRWLKRYSLDPGDYR